MNDSMPRDLNTSRLSIKSRLYVKLEDNVIKYLVLDKSEIIVISKGPSVCVLTVINLY